MLHLSLFLSNIELAKIGVSCLSSFVGLPTVVAILAGRLSCRTLSIWEIVGAGIIVIGVYIANAGQVDS